MAVRAGKYTVLLLSAPLGSGHKMAAEALKAKAPYIYQPLQPLTKPQILKIFVKHLEPVIKIIYHK